MKKNKTAIILTIVSILFVYENADAIVVQHSEKDSVYTDVYHFNGDIYEGPAKDSILDAIKVAKCL